MENLISDIVPCATKKEISIEDVLSYLQQLQINKIYEYECISISSNINHIYIFIHNVKDKPLYYNFHVSGKYDIKSNKILSLTDQLEQFKSEILWVGFFKLMAV